MILITGAAGKTGTAIIHALADQQEDIRAFVRRADQAGTLKAIGATETRIGDMRNEEDVRNAVDGVRAVYHIPPNMHPDEVEIGKLVIDAAVDAGVERFVYHSVLHPQTEEMPHHWKKLRVEEYLLTAGISFTITQPAPYMQNILSYWDSITADGTYAVPYATETRLSMVDLNDVADVAATVLTSDRHAGAIYELCGPDAPTQTEIATIISRHLGSSVRAEAQPRREWKETARVTGGLSDYAVETLLKMFEYYEAHNFVGNVNVLGWLLGRAPTAFDEFIARVVQERQPKTPEA